MIKERVLLVDDVPANLAVLTSALEPEGYEILAVGDGVTATKLAARAQPRVILLDIRMPGQDGLETCRQLKEQAATADIPVIFITALAESDSVLDGFRAGAVDYIVKPFRAEEVVSRVGTHVRLNRLACELREKNQALENRTAELTAEIERRHRTEQALRQADETIAVFSDLEASRWDVSGLIGRSPSLQAIQKDIQRLQQFASTSVLICGESGTGKELIARAIHHGCVRAKAPFVPVNCAAIPAELTESMLFGHIKGAFTGALADRKGFFEMAHGGSIFLDEIGDMPPALQAKLLRVLEDGCVTPVGATETRKVDVRVIAATNANLEARIAAGGFREDLYFRLARYVLRTPPLRDRPGDIPTLAEHFLRLFASEMGLKPPALEADALAALKNYAFPGNVRELKNILERALINSVGGSIQAADLNLPERSRLTPAAPASGQKVSEAPPLPLNLAKAEDALIQRALQEAGGNIAEAARLLGVHRTRIYRKLAQDESGADSDTSNVSNVSSATGETSPL